MTQGAQIRQPENLEYGTVFIAFRWVDTCRLIPVPANPQKMQLKLELYLDGC